MNHPIRRAVVCTEVNSNNVTVFAILAFTLFNGTFENSSHFTDSGLTFMIRDYYEEYKDDYLNYCDPKIPLFHRLHLSEDEYSLYPISTYHRYHSIFKTFANDYVDNIFPENTKIDAQSKLWMEQILGSDKRKTSTLQMKNRIKSVIGAIYFEQIRHKMLSNNNIFYVVVNYPLIIQEKDNQYSIIGLYLLILSIVYVTNVQLVTFTKNLQFLFDSKRAYLKMHRSLKSLENDFDRKDSHFIPLLRPSTVSVSTSA